MGEDLISNAFCLEESYYEEGLSLGFADGANAGRVEGRVVGVEKGFEKFVGISRIYGKTLVWGAMCLESQAAEEGPPSKMTISNRLLKKISLSSRLSRNLHTLHHSTNPDSLSKENTETAIAEAEDSYRRGAWKEKLIVRAVGEGVGAPTKATDYGSLILAAGAVSEFKYKAPKRLTPGSNIASLLE